MSYPSAEASTPDGFPPGLGDRRITGDTTYVAEVIPLCVDDGEAWFAVIFTDAMESSGERTGPAFTGCDLENPARSQTDITNVTEVELSPGGCPEPLVEH